ncbi:MAG: hypothetical protein F6K11_17535 [Leptolyngbya sp. SIO3F4]|nr:hypothetical protein [Leptolyngbya sp. SIO3F4]
MTHEPDTPKDLNRYILENQQPVVCDDDVTWRAFMTNGTNLLVAQNPACNFTVVTVFFRV